MAAVELIDETFIAADVVRIAAVVGDARRWKEWWPDLRLTVFMDRGLQGIRWSATGEQVGSLEVWIEPCFDGAVVHYYVRLDPRPAGSDPTEVSDGESAWLSGRDAARMRAQRAKAWKRVVWALKDELEADRETGQPARVEIDITATGKASGSPQ